MKKCIEHTFIETYVAPFQYRYCAECGFTEVFNEYLRGYIPTKRQHDYSEKQVEKYK